MFPKSNVQPIVESVCNKLLQDKSFDQVIQLHLNDQIANEINTQLAQVYMPRMLQIMLVHSIIHYALQVTLIIPDVKLKRKAILGHV